MIYELRTYSVLPGKMEPLLNRFRDKTIQLFERHRIKLIGAWTVEIGEGNTVIYLVAFEDWNQREQAMTAFRADPEWQDAVQQTERAGPLVERIHRQILRSTDFSPLR